MGALLISRQPRNPPCGIQGKTGTPETRHPRAPRLAYRSSPRLSLLAFVDLLDHLGDVVLVLPELGGVFQDLLFLLLGDALQILFRQLRIGHLGFGWRRLLRHRRRAAAPRRLRGLGLIDRLTFRADDRILVQVIEAGTAIGAQALRSPGLLRHAGLPPHKGAPKIGLPIAMIGRPCQKVILPAGTRFRASPAGDASRFSPLGEVRGADHRPRRAAVLQPVVSGSAGPLAGNARVPGDKSISHRALMVGALAVGETEIHGLLEGEDVLRSAAAMQALGAAASRDESGVWRVIG